MSFSRTARAPPRPISSTRMDMAFVSHYHCTRTAVACRRGCRLSPTGRSVSLREGNSNKKDENGSTQPTFVILFSIAAEFLDVVGAAFHEILPPPPLLDYFSGFIRRSGQLGRHHDVLLAYLEDERGGIS